MQRVTGDRADGQPVPDADVQSAVRRSGDPYASRRVPRVARSPFGYRLLFGQPRNDVLDL